MLGYLCNCHQVVQINNKTLSCQTNAFGIPQGSILGPVIFSLYVSDLKDVIPFTKISAGPLKFFQGVPGVFLLKNISSIPESMQPEWGIVHKFADGLNLTECGLPATQAMYSSIKPCKFDTIFYCNLLYFLKVSLPSKKTPTGVVTRYMNVMLCCA